MLGIIADCEFDKTVFNPLFYKIGQTPIVEIALRNFVKSDFAHKIILSGPTSHRVYFNNTVFTSKMADIHSITDNSKAIEPHFFGQENNLLERLWNAALSNNLTDVVLVRADDAFLPTWLINQAIKLYYQESQRYISTRKTYQKGLHIDVLPFWMLAEAKIFANGDLVSYLENTYVSHPLNNVGDNQIQTNLSLKPNNPEDMIVLEPLLEEASRGADLGDLIKEYNEQANI